MWVPACKVDDVDPDDVIGVRHEGVDYAVFRSPDDRYYATAGHCTHERELLCDGLVMDGEIECPKHMGRFKYATGAAQGAPVLMDLRTYPTKVHDDIVFLQVPGGDR
ncbi:MAG TPA: Rieske 2Fe-2S domain-containing protein [Pseudonocardia sp.]|jgi:3-phenylpropionate/trans-cinnamate dioxygenase ferredoxin subunit